MLCYNEWRKEKDTCTRLLSLFNRIVEKKASAVTIKELDSNSVEHMASGESPDGTVGHHKC